MMKPGKPQCMLQEAMNMYQRYTSRSGGGIQSGGSSLANRIRSAVMLVLVFAVILLAIFGGSAMEYRSESRTMYVRRIQTECNSALSLAPSLSRTAGASTAATLSKIRSYIYAMDTINQLHMGLDGGYLVENEVFTNLYSIIDEYYNRLITGMVTSEQQTQLSNALTELLNELSMLN